MNCIYKINNAADDVQWSRIIETNPFFLNHFKMTQLFIIYTTVEFVYNEVQGTLDLSSL